MDVVLLLLAACAIPLGLNIRACVLIHRDALSERSQKLFQLLLVWLVPLFGAIIVLWVHRADEEPSGTYPEDKDAGEDFGSSASALRSVRGAIDGD